MIAYLDASVVLRLVLAAVDLIDVSRAVLRRASEPFPTPLGTLDAIHLSTALLWREAWEKSNVSRPRGVLPDPRVAGGPSAPDDPAHADTPPPPPPPPILTLTTHDRELATAARAIGFAIAGT